jgi:hypothetical protein
MLINTLINIVSELQATEIFRFRPRLLSNDIISIYQ